MSDNTGRSFKKSDIKTNEHIVAENIRKSILVESLLAVV